MSKKPKYEYENFLEDARMLEWVREENLDKIAQFHNIFTQEGLSLNIKSNKTTPFILNYTNKRKGVFSLYLKEKGLTGILKAHNVADYGDVFTELPNEMIENIQNSPMCKNLARKTEDEKGCGWKDCFGYDFNIEDVNLQICRYSCFQFEVTDETTAHLEKLALCELTLQRK